MEIVIKTILRQIINQIAGTQNNLIKKLASCDPCVRKSGLKTGVFILRLSICGHKNSNIITITNSVIPQCFFFST